MEVGLHPNAATAGAVNEAPGLRKPARTTAVVLAAHGERGGARANCALLSHADRLSWSGRYAAVAAGVLNGEPPLESALAVVRRAAADELLVYPVFMSDGYFVRQVLAQRVAAAGPSVRILAPLGLDPNLLPLMMGEALAAAARAAFDPGAARLLVVGHGSSSRPNGASARATRRAAELLAAERAFAETGVAFLEEPPFLTGGLADSSRSTVVLGFFSGEGLHALEDVPAAIAEQAAKAVYTGPIGALPEVADIIARAIDAAAAPPA
jgi:sirohydrochlorin ferrochelatase